MGLEIQWEVLVEVEIRGYNLLLPTGWVELESLQQVEKRDFGAEWRLAEAQEAELRNR